MPILFRNLDLMIARKSIRERIDLLIVDVIITSECIHLYLLCIVPRCLFWEVSLMYWSHVVPQCSYREIQ